MELYDPDCESGSPGAPGKCDCESCDREKQAQKKERYEQLNLFTDYGKKELEEKEVAEAKEREKHLQQALLEIKKRYGKNAVLKGMNLEEGATTIERNSQIGGHKA